LLLAILGACIFLLRLLAPPDLLDQDQERPAAYVLDVVKNGHWICQRDLFGDVTSKPPLWTWVSALSTLAVGRIGAFSLYLPGALAGLGCACLVLATGRKYFGVRAAFIGGLGSMMTTAGLKEFGLARTDGVFAFTVTLSALLAFRAWTRGTGWIWFWLASAAATLTKGPLGVILAAGGLLAVFWERKTKASGAEPESHVVPEPPGPSRNCLGGVLLGFCLFLLITGGWFLLAYWQLGSAVSAKLLGRELTAHAVGGNGGHFPGKTIWQPPLYYLGRGAPWSLFAYYGLWRIWRRADADPAVQKFERFLFCWFVFGLILFSLAPHQRADLLWPIMPAGALVAGRELARLTQGIRPTVLRPVLALLVVLALTGFAFYYFGPRARTAIIRRTGAVRELAADLDRQAGQEFPLTHVDDPMTLQVYLNTLRPQVSFERAAELLRGPEAAFVAVDDLSKLLAARRLDDPPMHTLLPVSGPSDDAVTRIISNRPTFSANEPTAFCFGKLFVRAHGARLLQATERGFCFTASSPGGEVRITNESNQTLKIRVRSERNQLRKTQEGVLQPNGTTLFVIDQAPHE
jgi:4-amino-4-deoxy-L-arabinose transferase-like glycosyltransferase